MTHPIEAESYRRMRALVDLTHLPPLTRAVTERAIHASADLDYATDLVTDESVLAAAVTALAAGAPVVADVGMVAAGIGGRDVVCRLRDAEPRAGETRSAAGIRVAATAVGAGAVYVIGCAPTALYALVDADVRPALVVGLPVGFVDAAESKQALRDSGLPAITNTGRKGGSAVAAAAANALIREADRA